MKKKLSKVAVLALSLLLLAGMVASVSAAHGTTGQAGLRQGKAGQQKGQTALQAVSDLTGLSVADIRSQRAEGNSLAAIAEKRAGSNR